MDEHDDRIDIGSTMVGFAHKDSNPQYTYNGKAKKPAVWVMLIDGEVLIENTDYTVSYQDNVNAGKARVIIEGIGAYKGETETFFEINKARQNISVIVDKNRNIAKGENINLTVTGAKTQVTYESSNESVATVDQNGIITGVSEGTASITVIATDTSNYYSDIKSVNVTVELIDLSDATVTLSQSEFDYDEKEHKPKAIVEYNGEKLKEGIDFNVDYCYDYVSAGTAQVDVYGIGGYTGTVSAKLVINKAKLTVTARSAEKNYGDVDPDFEYDVSCPTVEGDGKDNAVAGILEREPGEAVGTYVIKQGSLECINDDYELVQFKQGIFKIVADDSDENNPADDNSDYQGDDNNDNDTENEADSEDKAGTNENQGDDEESSTDDKLNTDTNTGSGSETVNNPTSTAPAVSGNTGSGSSKKKSSTKKSTKKTTKKKASTKKTTKKKTSTKKKSSKTSSKKKSTKNTKKKTKTTKKSTK